MFNVLYYDHNGVIQSMQVEMSGNTRETARLNIEHGFRELFRDCVKIHIG